jgi:hypothetical protein
MDGKDVSMIGVLLMASIPAFGPDGLLPPGDHAVTFEQLRASILVLGPAEPRDAPNWDAAWRLRLVDNLEILASQLWSVGIEEVFADGSFAEDKDHPNDIDGYFVCDLGRLCTGELQRSLNALDPRRCWDWSPASRRRCAGFQKLQLPMWHAYRVELYPHVPGLGMGCGILDRWGHELEFPSAFRRSRRDGAPRGIVRLLKGASA